MKIDPTVKRSLWNVYNSGIRGTDLELDILVACNKLGIKKIEAMVEAMTSWTQSILTVSEEAEEYKRDRMAYDILVDVKGLPNTPEAFKEWQAKKSNE